MIMHAPLYPGKKVSSTELYWFTTRNKTAYAPSSAGYVDMDNPGSVDGILKKLLVAKSLMADPAMAVYFHPYVYAEGPEGSACKADRRHQAARLPVCVGQQHGDA